MSHPLTGKLVSAFLDDEGFRTFRVARVIERGRGRKRQAVAVIGYGARYLGRDRWDWKGSRFKADLDTAFARPAAGVVVRRRHTIPLAEFLNTKGGNR